MRCERCKALQLVDYEGGVYDCIIGVTDDELVEFSDGEYGCKLHWKTIQRCIRERDSCYEISMAEDQRMCNPEKYDEVLEKANGKRYIEEAKHCVGLDRKSHTKGMENYTSDHTGITSTQIMMMKYGAILDFWDLRIAIAHTGRTKKRRSQFSLV